MNELLGEINANSGLALQDSGDAKDRQEFA